MDDVPNFIVNMVVNNYENWPALPKIMNECIVACFLTHRCHRV